jgi:hypothetical protein
MDIIPRLRCSSCGARDGFRVTIERDRRDRSQLAGDVPPIAVIAEPEAQPTAQKEPLGLGGAELGRF